MQHLPALVVIISERAAKLEKFAGRIMSCRVIVEPAGKHHAYGNQYEVRIDIRLPNGEVVATRAPSENKKYKDIAVSIRDALNAAARQLEDYVRIQRGDVKRHVRTPHARISKLMPEENYGFLRTSDGREIFFHRNSVLNQGFDLLEVGIEVSFAEEEGERGAQASTVTLVGHHGRE